MRRRNLLALLTLLPIACARLEGNDEQDARPAYELSADEVRLALALAERGLDIPEKPLSPMDRVVYVKIDLLPDSRAETGQRQVMVHHYRYRGDETILPGGDHAAQLEDTHAAFIDTVAGFILRIRR